MIIPPCPYRELIEQLAARRRELGLSQERLGERIGISARLVNKWECGTRRPSGYFLHLWVLALGCKLVLTVLQPHCTTPKNQAATARKAA